jgi:hypothetical protein
MSTSTTAAAPVVSKDKPVEVKKKTPIGVHLLAGGGAGLAEALVCREYHTSSHSYRDYPSDHG